MRRRVFFIAGFDPRGASNYYQRLTEMLAPFADVGPMEPRGPYNSGWQSRVPASGSETTFEFLHWDDIVSRNWRAKGRIHAQFAAMRSLIVYMRCGLVARARDGARAVRWALFVMGLAPLVFLAATTLISLVAGILGARTLPMGGWLALLVLPMAFCANDFAWRKLNLEWLAKGFACIVETAMGETPGWDDRCANFAARIAEVERAGQSDEIVVIGHSLGAILAMKTLSRYLASGERPVRPIAFATLGNIIPFYIWIEPSRRAMREGEAVANSQFVQWVDVTSGSDPASDFRKGPRVGATSQATRYEPMFHSILTTEHFHHIKRRPLDFDLQCLRTADRPGGLETVRMMGSPAPFLAAALR